VRILDLDLEIRISDNLQYLDLFTRTMLEFSPEAVGVTSMYSNSLQAEHLVRVAKRLDGTIMTIAGGSHFGAAPRQSLRRIPELDYVIEGEAEKSFATLLSGAASIGIPRLHYRVNGELRANAKQGLMNLADLPPMWTKLRSTVPLERYTATIPSSSPRRIAYIEAGRGCPFACTFCATAPFWEQRYRVKPVERIVEEIRYLYEEFNYDSFVLVHDLLTVNAKFMSAFSDSMLALRLPVEWMANSRTDIHLHGLLPKLKAAGCWKLFFGIESASARIQKEIDKHLEMDEVLTTIQDLTDHRISATTSFVIGFPTETSPELSTSIALGARLKLMGVETVQFHRLRLFPPSGLCRAGLSGEFDAESLKLEYPFIEISGSDFDAIRSDPEFFSGYWTPRSNAGSPEQLAQVEMFFHHAVALAPSTIAAASQFAGPSLVSTFYNAIAECKPIRREKLDWETGDLFGNWQELQPLLEFWLTTQLPIEGWKLGILRAVLTYEGQRLGFVTDHENPSALARGTSWAAFESELDVPKALESLQAGTPLTPQLLCPKVVALKRHSSGRFEAFTVSLDRVPDLLRNETDLLSVLG